mmetsp:Transcript_14549/g.32031  ORF Transcript_14549/g.32031 Transcript_14549/m.32031 type:complete len:447 (-) Transcript_14549:192-1532(-)
MTDVADTAPALKLPSPWVGFGTAGYGGCSSGYQLTYDSVFKALENNFRRFDTAEAEGWYCQEAVGTALRDYTAKRVIDEADKGIDISVDEAMLEEALENADDNASFDPMSAMGGMAGGMGGMGGAMGGMGGGMGGGGGQMDEKQQRKLEREQERARKKAECEKDPSKCDEATARTMNKAPPRHEKISCASLRLRISSKIAPYDVTSSDNIRKHAEKTRKQLLGFCDMFSIRSAIAKGDGSMPEPFPLDVYYLHAPECWEGWHPKCETGEEMTMSLREAWEAMELVKKDKNAVKIGLSNVSEEELQDIIDFVKERWAKSMETGEPTNAIMPHVIQNHADPLEPNIDMRLLCQENGIDFVSYSTLGTQQEFNEEGENPVLTDAVVKKMAEKYERSEAEVVLSWALQSGMSVIPRSQDEEHIKQLSNLITDPSFVSWEDLDEIDTISIE